MTHPNWNPGGQGVTSRWWVDKSPFMANSINSKAWHNHSEIFNTIRTIQKAWVRLIAFSLVGGVLERYYINGKLLITITKQIHMFFVDYFSPVILQIFSWSIPSIMLITHLLPLSTDMLPLRHAKPVRHIFLTCCSGWQHNTIGGKRFLPTSTCMSSQMPHGGLVWLWLIGKMGVSSLPPSKHGQFCSLETPGCGIFGIRTI